jgi:hypothetical protein
MTESFEWTPESWACYKNYSDGINIDLHITDSPELEPNEDWFLQVYGSLEVDQDWLMQQVERLGFGAEYDDSGNIVRGQPAYDLSFTSKKVSWGADGAFLFIVMTIASGVIGNASYDLFKGIGRQIAGKLKHFEGVMPFGESEAIERAKWITIEKFKVNESDLTLTAIESADSSFVVTFTHQSSVKYTFELTCLDGLVLIARTRRELPG